jgi:hypothetical protein
MHLLSLLVGEADVELPCAEGWCSHKLNAV